MTTELSGLTVVLGVTGGISAYKAVEVCRRLVDAGAHVAPVLTPSALDFVGEVTFSALASEPARHELFGGDDSVPHVRLGRRADLVLVAPATARFIGSYAAGISSDLLTATVLATKAPVLVCPAMHTEMWEHASVQENLATLRRRGVEVLEPGTGRLAGGDVGPGRLPDPGTIVATAVRMLSRRAGGPAADLAGRRVLVTAGGTREPIDPVRYLANRSTGRQGHAIADAARERGADVVLVTTSELAVDPLVSVVRVETASQMADAVLLASQTCDLVVMAAAVADFTPETVAPAKLKKADGIPSLRLVPTLDILAELGRHRRPGQVIVGFAAETCPPAESASAKLSAKGADLIVGNDVGREGVGFGGETNAVTIVSRDGARIEVALSSKASIAAAVLDAAVGLFAPLGATVLAGRDTEGVEVSRDRRDRTQLDQRDQRDQQGVNP